jgi:hypothetical protein
VCKQAKCLPRRAFRRVHGPAARRKSLANQAFALSHEGRFARMPEAAGKALALWKALPWKTA